MGNCLDFDAKTPTAGKTRALNPVPVSPPKTGSSSPTIGKLSSIGSSATFGQSTGSGVSQGVGGFTGADPRGAESPGVHVCGIEECHEEF